MSLKRNRSKKAPSEWMNSATIEKYDSSNDKPIRLSYDWRPRKLDQQDKYQTNNPAYMTPKQYNIMIKHRNSRVQQVNIIFYQIIEPFLI